MRKVYTTKESTPINMNRSDKIKVNFDYIKLRHTKLFFGSFKTPHATLELPFSFSSLEILIVFTRKPTYFQNMLN